MNGTLDQPYVALVLLGTGAVCALVYSIYEVLIYRLPRLPRALTVISDALISCLSVILIGLAAYAVDDGVLRGYTLLCPACGFALTRVALVRLGAALSKISVRKKHLDKSPVDKS